MMRSKSSVILIILQIALTIAIVSNAAYIIHERINVMQRDTGIPEAQIIKTHMYFYDEDVDIIKQLALDAQQVKTIPGVIEASAINAIPLSDSGSSWMLRNQLENNGAISTSAGAFLGDYNVVSALGQKVSRGRNFRPDDMVYRTKGDEVPQVTIITQALADLLFPSQEALGQTLYSLDIPIKIIGIVDRMYGPWVHFNMVERNMFIPMLSDRKNYRFSVIVEEDKVDRVLSELNDFLLRLEGRRVINHTMTVAQLKDSSYQNDRLMTNMLFVIITVLVFITALGIAGMTIFNVNRRQKQIGTRRALGASKGDIISYFMTESAIISVIGIALGVITAFVLNNYLMSYFNSAALEFSYIAGTIASIVVVVIVSVLVPARKASLISPAIATRSV